MTTSSGAAAVDRLTHLKESLERSMQAVERELAQTNRDVDYRETYLSYLSGLCRQAESLEDSVRSKLRYA